MHCMLLFSRNLRHDVHLQLLLAEFYDCICFRNLKKGAESKTNAIDRTVANLLFTRTSMSPALPCERPVCNNNENTSVTGMQYSLDQSSGYPQATYYEDMDDE